MTVFPSISVDLAKPETHSEAFIASRVLFIPMTCNGRRLYISAADDEAEIVPVHVAIARRSALVEPETHTGQLQLTAVFA